MPELTRVLSAADMARKQRGMGNLDLAPYVTMIEAILAEGGVGGTVTLGPEESQRTEKGRLTRAARERGMRLVWRRGAADELRFVLAPEGEPAPDARPRRPRAERRSEQVVIDAVMTPDVADVTDTEASPTEEQPAPPRPRRRGTAAS